MNELCSENYKVAGDKLQLNVLASTEKVDNEILTKN